jgi:Pyridoxal-phosphate dependent enzyme
MESILEAIGNTPLIRVHRCAPENGAELWLKLELRNPSGSLKDRMALAMIEGAEPDGLISRGDTVVEYTLGSTGPALALVCRAKGYRALIAIADCFTEERMQLMRALGAEIELIPVGGTSAAPLPILRLSADAAKEPSDERTEYQPGFGRERNVGGHAYKDAEHYPDQRADANKEPRSPSVFPDSHSDHPRLPPSRWPNGPEWLRQTFFLEGNAQNRVVGKGGKLSLPSTAPDSLTKDLRNPFMGRRRSASVVYLRRPFAPRGVPELNPDELRHPPIIARN